MTPLESAVVDAIVRTNHPVRRNDPPYPASLLPIAREVIEAVRQFDEGAGK